MRVNLFQLVLVGREVVVFSDNVLRDNISVYEYHVYIYSFGVRIALFKGSLVETPWRFTLEV